MSKTRYFIPVLTINDNSEISWRVVRIKHTWKSTR